MYQLQGQLQQPQLQQPRVHGHRHGVLLQKREQQHECSFSAAFLMPANGAEAVCTSREKSLKNGADETPRRAVVYDQTGVSLLLQHHQQQQQSKAELEK